MEARDTTSAVCRGDKLCEEIEAADISNEVLARALDGPLDLVRGVAGGTASITAVRALRLERYFGMTLQVCLIPEQAWILRRAEIVLAVRPPCM